MAGRILAVDDDLGVLNSLRRALAHEGYEVVTAEDGESALLLAEIQPPDLVILDVMLPGLDGLTVCRRLRGKSLGPILMLTARDTVPDRVAGLDEGADDYLVKPFALDELLARVRALLRRNQPAGNSLFFDDLSLDTEAKQVSRGGQSLSLTPNEYKLLETFLRHPRRVLSRDQLAQQVWGFAHEGESNFIDVAVKDLRRKLEAGGRPRIIQTVRGFGYALRKE
ncbi:MAG: response regulator transcription factor [Dehalococcoidia bacterium]